MIEKELPKEILKEPTIKKIYNIFGLLQTIFVGFRFTIFTLGLFVIANILKNQNSKIYYYINIDETLVSNILSLFMLINFLTSLLFIIIGLALYILYLYNRTDKNKKTYGKIIMMRGIVGVILILILWFLISTIANLLFPPQIQLRSLPSLLNE